MGENKHNTLLGLVIIHKKLSIIDYLNCFLLSLSKSTGAYEHTREKLKRVFVTVPEIQQIKETKQHEVNILSIISNYLYLWLTADPLPFS